jgi:hypothetical protein
MGSNWTLAHA